MKPLILASQSPRRKEILEFFSLPFIQICSHFEEESIPFEGDPIDYAQTLSQKKAEVIAKNHPQEIILAADTVVFSKGRLFNKPLNRDEATEFLLSLGGNWQSVITAVTVRKGEEIFSGHEETRLLFHKLTKEEIELFHANCNPFDKAGGYAIEKSSNLIVSRMEGCYYNVLGLPINQLRLLLAKVGINLWHFLKPSCL